MCHIQTQTTQKVKQHHNLELPFSGNIDVLLFLFQTHQLELNHPIRHKILPRDGRVCVPINMHRNTQNPKIDGRRAPPPPKQARSLNFKMNTQRNSFKEVRWQPYCGQFQLQQQLWLLDWHRNRLIQIVITNCKYCHFLFVRNGVVMHKIQVIEVNVFLLFKWSFMS